MSKKKNRKKIEKAFKQLGETLWTMDLGLEDLDMIDRLSGDIAGNAKVKAADIKDELRSTGIRSNYV